jgi:hypothetical protein
METVALAGTAKVMTNATKEMLLVRMLAVYNLYLAKYIKIQAIWVVMICGE